MSPRRVVIVAFPGVQSLDVAGPYEVFAGAAAEAESHGRSTPYDVTVASIAGQPVTTDSGLQLGTTTLPHPPDAIDTLVIPGGTGVYTSRHDPALVDWVRTAAPRCRRVATVCTGSFIAAEAGLLDGCRVTTHWARADRLQADFPALQVDPDPIYIRDGRLWTSAGVTAGIDLALAMVDDDLGHEVAQTVARWLVMFLHRPGGQTQFAAPVWMPRAERSTVRAVQALVEAAPGGDHSVARMAAAAAMSVRHFGRVFTAEVGEPPARYVERVRVEAARRELESTDDTVDVVAARCGFGTAETLRRSFHRRLGVAPDTYRRRFRVA
ncbi:MAG TPA: AraC family transcriptional regulator [Acidimicrobiaceae bacterium]|nr:AraC family transcriptional regulator [Acidimicrobiaceae bacterium]